MFGSPCRSNSGSPGRIRNAARVFSASFGTTSDFAAGLADTSSGCTFTLARQRTAFNDSRLNWDGKAEELLAGKFDRCTGFSAGSCANVESWVFTNYNPG